MPSSAELERLTRALGRAVASVAGAAVTYHRGASSVGVTATLGRSTFDTDDGYGATIQVTSHDFLVFKSELLIDGSAVVPASGDRIRRTIGGVVHVYEVMNPPYAPSGTTDVRYRIHSKFIKTE
jgi:hypothetical protein